MGPVDDSVTTNSKSQSHKEHPSLHYPNYWPNGMQMGNTPVSSTQITGRMECRWGNPSLQYPNYWPNGMQMGTPQSPVPKLLAEWNADGETPVSITQITGRMECRWEHPSLQYPNYWPNGMKSPSMMPWMSGYLALIPCRAIHIRCCSSSVADPAW